MPQEVCIAKRLEETRHQRDYKKRQDNKNKVIAEYVKALEKKDTALAEKDRALAEKDKALAEYLTVVAEKDKALTAKAAELHNLHTRFASYVVLKERAEEEAKRMRDQAQLSKERLDYYLNPVNMQPRNRG